MRTNIVEISDEVTGIEAAVRKVGGQTKLAEALNLRQQSVSLWVRQGYVSEKHVDEISALTHIPTSRLMKPDTVRRALDGMTAQCAA
jgi:hypothetical protein